MRTGAQSRLSTAGYDLWVHEVKWQAPLAVRLIPTVQYPAQCAMGCLRFGVRHG